MAATALALEMPNLVEAQDRARPIIRRIMRRWPNEVEDILQIAALKALIHHKGFRGNCQYQTWFTRIAMNQALMHIRTQKGRKANLTEFVGGPDLLDSLPMHQPSQYEVLWQEYKRAVLLETIEGLPPRLRLEAQLALEDDMPGNDNARKSRKFRVRRDLRPLLQERLGGL